MTTPDTLSEAQQKAQHLLSCFDGVDGFRQRVQQQEMMTELVSGMVNGGELMLEAPTGTGKTLAYLCGAVALADTLNKKVVIATGTINLQQQLFERDIPWFMDVTGGSFLYALAKGRSRYLCLSNLTGVLDDSSQQDFIDDNVVSIKSAGQSAIPAAMRQRLEDGSWNGDLDDWPDAIPAGVSRALVSTSESCTGKQCDHYHECPFQLMRSALQSAEVIVANHDLLLSDLDLGGGCILPPPDECLYVVDEAHGLPRKAVVHAAANYTLNDFSKTLEFAEKLLQILPKILPRKSAQIENDALEEALQLAAVSNQNLQHTLGTSNFVRNLLQKTESNQSVDARMHLGELVTVFVGERGAEIQQGVDVLLKALNRYTDWLKDEYESGKLKKHLRDNFLLQVSAVIGKLNAVRNYWRLFFKADPENGPAIARWIDVSRQNNVVSLTLHASPSWAVEYLQEKFWAKAWGTVLISATLRALGNFNYYRMLSGLPDTAAGVNFSSTFDYAVQARLTVPWMEKIPSGMQTRAYFDEVAEILPGLLHPQEGALVLFTSRESMNQVYAKLPSKFRGTVLMQGLQLSRGALLEAHQQRIEKGQGSVIFGLGSFAEGIDLPGDLCRHVVITRIPFSAYGHPVAKNIKEWMGSRNFMQMSLPAASVRLIQACGRLLRNEDDRGQITILDRRLMSKAYGKTLLQHLPAYQVRVENSAMGLMPDLPVARQAAGTLIY